MPETTLAELLERNARHVDSLSEDHFDAVQSAQRPTVVSVCCSDSRVIQEGMWAVEEPGWLFTTGNIGNQVREKIDGEWVVGGDVLYPIQYTDTDIALVVGHTGCGAVTAALEAVRTDGVAEHPPGIQARVESLRPIIEAGLADERVSADSEEGLVGQLVEYNVDRQVEFLRKTERVSKLATVLGFVYDFQGVYGDVPGRCYLVNHEGETAMERLEAAAPDGYESHVNRLL